MKRRRKDDGFGETQKEAPAPDQCANREGGGYVCYQVV